MAESKSNPSSGPDPTNRGGYEVIDLSIGIKDDPSPLIPVKVTNLDHADGAVRAQMDSVDVAGPGD